MHPELVRMRRQAELDSTHQAFLDARSEASKNGWPKPRRHSDLKTGEHLFTRLRKGYLARLAKERVIGKVHLNRGPGKVQSRAAAAAAAKVEKAALARRHENLKGRLANRRWRGEKVNPLLVTRAANQRQAIAGASDIALEFRRRRKEVQVLAAELRAFLRRVLS